MLRIVTLGAGIAAFAMTGVSATAQETERSYVIATAAEGGTYYPVGVAIATAAQIYLGLEHPIAFEAQSTEGSIQNAVLMRNGDVQFAIMQALIGDWAAQGSNAFEDIGPDEELRGVAMLWPDLAHFFIANDLVETGTVADLAALEGRAFSMGPLGSGTEATNRILFSNYGLNLEDWQIEFHDYSESLDLLEVGAISAVNIEAGRGADAVHEAMTRLRDQVTLLSVSDDDMARFDGGLGLVTAATIGQGDYPGLEGSVQSLALPNFLAVRADVPEEDVFLLTQTMFQNLEFLCDFHAAACEISTDTALDGLPVPLHPGAARFFASISAQSAPVD